MRQRRPVVVLVTVSAAMGATVVNLSIMNVALPTLGRQLSASNAQLEWIVASYSLTFAGFLLAAGSLADRVGRKLVLMSGLGIFALCSAMAAATNTSTELIAARAGMGFGAAMIMPTTLSIITSVYPTEAGLRSAIAVWAATATAGAVVAPLVAGSLLRVFWWGSLFLMNVVLAVVVLVATAVFVPESKPRRGGSVDWPGIVLSVAFSALLVFALIEGPSLGWTDPILVTSLLGSIVVLVGFCLVELHSKDPLLDVRLFRNRSFAIASWIVGMQYLLSTGIGYLSTQYLQLVRGLSPLTAGLCTVPAAAVVVVVSPIGAKAFGRFGARAITTAGMTLATIALLAINLTQTDSSVFFIVGPVVLLSGGIALMTPGTTSLGLNAVPRDRAGMASGTQSASRQLGGALGVAVLGSVLAARYTAVVSTGTSVPLLRDHIPAAKRSLAAALDVHVTASAAHQLIHLAQAAFVDGLHAAATVAAGVALVTAAASFWILRPRTAHAVEPLHDARQSMTKLVEGTGAELLEIPQLLE